MPLFRRTSSLMLASLALAGAAAVVPAAAQAPAPAPGTPPAGGQAPAGQPAAGTPAGPPRPARPGIKPYAEVVTKEAKTDEGIFKVHRIDDRILYEIPAAMLEKEFLWATKLRK